MDAQQRLTQADTAGRSRREVEIMQRELAAWEKGREASERLPFVAAEYLAAVGGRSLQEYAKQIAEIEARHRAEMGKRMRPDEAGAWVLLVLSVGILASSSASATLQDQYFACQSRGGTWKGSYCSFF